MPGALFRGEWSLQCFRHVRSASHVPLVNHHGLQHTTKELASNSSEALFAQLHRGGLCLGRGYVATGKLANFAKLWRTAYRCVIGFVPRTYREFWHIVITATHMHAPIGKVSIHTVLCIDRSSAAHRPLIDHWEKPHRPLLLNIKKRVWRPILRLFDLEMRSMRYLLVVDEWSMSGRWAVDERSMHICGASRHRVDLWNVISSLPTSRHLDWTRVSQSSGV